MSADRIKEIRERVEKATAGPWEFMDETHNQFVSVRKGDQFDDICALAGIVGRDKDFQFIAHARQDIPWLLTELEAAQAELANCRAAGMEYIKQTDPLLACVDLSTEEPTCGKCRACFQAELARLKSQLADALKVTTAGTIEHMKTQPR